jgi:DNA modification methylase
MKGDVVLDPFAGSASTLLASFLMQRRAIGYEKNREFFEVAEARLNEFLVMKKTRDLEEKENATTK